MAQAKCGVDCQTYAQTDTCSQGRVFDAPVTVAPSDDERLAHGGCRAVVDEVQDTKVKISEALEAAARASFGADGHVRRGAEGNFRVRGDLTANLEGEGIFIGRGS